jgi:hypothetical protein
VAPKRAAELAPFCAAVDNYSIAQDYSAYYYRSRYGLGASRRDR